MRAESLWFFRCRPLKALVAGFCLSAGSGLTDYLLLPCAMGGDVPEPITITNTIEDLRSLRDTLGTGEVHDRLEVLLACLPIWRIGTEEVLPGRTYRHFFEFGLPHRHTARVYRVSIIAEWDSQAQLYVPRETTERYGEAPRDLPRPMLTGTIPLKIFSAALVDEALYEQLASWLGESSGEGIWEVSVSLVQEGGEGSADLYLLGFHHGGYEGEPGTVSRYWQAEYDSQEGTTSFYQD